jgi:peptidoglycan/LPS O-acetylase OafA/YrhL
MLSGAGGILGLAGFGFKTTGNTVVFNVLSYEFSLLFFVGLISYAVQLETGLFYRALTLKPLRYVGTISYFAYLIHQPMLLLIHSRPLALLTTLAVCAVSWELLEKRFIAPRRKEATAQRTELSPVPSL